MAKFLHLKGRSKPLSRRVLAWYLTHRRQRGRRKVTPTPIVVPAAPVAGAAQNVTFSGFKAVWGAVDGATGYHLDVATDAGFTSFVANQEDHDVGDVLSFDVGSLQTFTGYFYRVRAVNAAARSDNSNVVSVTTLPAPAPPLGPPNNVSAYAEGADVSFNWETANVGNAEGFELEYRVTENGDEPWISLGMVFRASDVSGYVTMPGSGLTEFRMRSVNGERYSAWSDVVTVAMPVVAPVIDGGGFFIDTMTVNWSYNGAVPDGFRVIRYSSENPETQELASIGPESRSFDDPDVVVGVTYYYQIMAYNSMNDAFSDYASFTAE